MPKYRLDTPYRGLGGSIVELDENNPAVLAGYATLYTGPDDAVTPDNHPITDRLIARDIARDSELASGGASVAEVIADPDFETAVNGILNDTLDYGALTDGILTNPTFSDTLDTAITNATAFTDLQTSVDTSISGMQTALDNKADASALQTVSDSLGTTETAVNTLVDTTIPALPTVNDMNNAVGAAIDGNDFPGQIATAVSDFAATIPAAALQDDTASRPSSPVTGQIYFDTDLGTPIWFDGGAWVDSTGTVV